MEVDLKVFGPYGVRPRVREEMEREFKEWVGDKSLTLKDILPVTAALPDRTTLVLVFYNEDMDETETSKT